MPNTIDVAVVGGGPAGIAAATAAALEGASVLLIEREAKLGGILKQCIHDGFGLIRYGQKLSGPEYAYREILALNETEALIMTNTMVSCIDKVGNDFLLTLVSEDGLSQIIADRLILATGCRERTAKQIDIYGTRPSGVFTAGAAQYYINILGQMPAKRCIILGSGDIGLIMARRLALEGADVLGVYEAKQTPGGLLRNVLQCVNDFDIPLKLGHTVTRLFGTQRLEAVETYQVDNNLEPIPGTSEIVDCDTLIVSVGLIPENELAEMLGIELSTQTRGPICDQNYMTKIEGVFSCGNAQVVSDLVDDVSISGEAAGQSAARYRKGHKEEQRLLVPENASSDLPHVASHGDRAIKEFYCITCPSGCLLRIIKCNNPYDLEIEGHQCERGVDFARAELTNPMRSLTTTVRTTFADIPALPVRTDGEIPKALIWDAIRVLRRIVVSERLGCGVTVLNDLAGSGVRVIATGDMLSKL